ncbi:MAG: PSD1 and planctomycete cytochrome C domain-containing protein [Bythopirellula sp.]|nr:PSD1 and planctomycete cytochrome C domain-containing protein [Bythopirellula sp.]
MAACRLILTLLAWTNGIGLVIAQPAELHYDRDVRPILSDKCFRCHGFNEASRQADLRLDVAESAYDDRDGIVAIAPGDLAGSEVWRRITSTDETEQMPPPDSHLVLSDEQKDILRRWIEKGAKYAQHWSFIPPAKAALPNVAVESWPQNEIDWFVLARLDAENLKPSPAADRRTLIRRLSLDLTGLPPSAAEVEAFVADQDEHAYEQLVDRLLESPHFGERMTLDWLDAARYADTNGYSIDGGRHLWLWRDWVIDAFNRNLPYDQFLVEQLAGDLLPRPTAAQLIATGFQRNNMVTHEGGTIPEENLTNYNVDRVKTLGEAVLGLTLGCAQCHDHKYDPLTQHDYYQLFAYFNTLSDQGLDGNSGKNARPMFEAKTVLLAADLAAVREKIAALREQLAHPTDADVASWEADQRRELNLRGKDFQLHGTELLNVSTPNAGAGFDIDEARFVRISHPAELLAYDVSLRLPKLSQPVTGLRIVFHPVPSAPGGGWGYGSVSDKPTGSEKPSRPEKGSFVLTSFSASAEAVPGDQANLNRLARLDHATANCWDPNYRPENVLDTRNENGWSPDLTHDGPVHITMTFAEPLSSTATPFVAAHVNFGHGRKLVAARFEIFAVTGRDDGSPLPESIITILQTPTRDRTADQRGELRAYYSAHASATRPLRVSLENFEQRLEALTEKFPTMVMDQAEKPRDTFLLTRGDYAQPGEKVSPGTPTVLPKLPADAPANRLGLAKWIVMRDNPLTARVAVNRFWQLFFGTGIVLTTADFGAQGEWPSHPELLDWLAVDFIDSGWDTKALVRKIVTSATYRQSSVADVALAERDPANRLLARGPRFRLPAEFIRDAALQVSGLLVDWQGGPSVNPYTPGDLWREISHYGSTPATAQTFVQDHGEKLYRRSLYTYWKRTVPPPNMVAFDAPNRETCVVARPSTTTPLQALVLLNDVQFVEAARAFAQRVVAQTDQDADRLRWAFQECVSRPPSEQEFVVLARALGRERARYAADESAAREFLALGESPRDETIPLAEHAAWSQVATLLLNLSETVTRN